MRKIIIVLAMTGVFGATACSSSPEPTPATIGEPAQPVVSEATATTINADIKDFSHEDLEVKVGTTVVWTNRGGATHITSGTGKEWDSGRLANGESFSFTFTEPATFNYRCNIHPSMTATINVIE